MSQTKNPGGLMFHQLKREYYFQYTLTMAKKQSTPVQNQASNPSHTKKSPHWWTRWEFILGLAATLTTVTGITLKDFLGDSKAGDPISLTVFTYDATKGKQHPILQMKGHVTLDVNGERKQEAIDDKGKAVFQNLNIGDPVLLDVVFSEPYRAFWPDSTYLVPADGQIYLAVALKNLDRLHGHIFYQEKPLAGVVVALESLRDTSDELGFYQLNIPPTLQKREQKLLLHHPEFSTQTETVYPQTDQDWDFVLKK